MEEDIYYLKDMVSKLQQNVLELQRHCNELEHKVTQLGYYKADEKHRHPEYER